MRTLTLLALLVACSDPGDPYKVVPGGGNPGGNGTQVDAPANPDRSDAMDVMARVCVMADPRNQSNCATTGADGLTVRLGAAVATTTADGSFVITPPLSSNLVWRVTGPDLVPSIVPYIPNAVIPAITATRYNDFVLDNGVIFSEGEGHLFVRIVANDAPVVGATATLDPPSASAIFYDGMSDQVWDQDATGGFGMVWIPDAVPVRSDIAIAIPLADPVVARDAPIEDLSITFITIDASPQ